MIIIVLFKTRRNRKISLTEYYDLVYEYQNDCLTTESNTEKHITKIETWNLKKNIFTITLFPLTSLDQRVDNSLYRN